MPCLEKRNKIPVTNTTCYTRSGRRAVSIKMLLQKQGYLLEKKIAAGAFSKVQTAHSIVTNRPVVIKIIEKSSLDEELWEEFVPREIDTLCRIEHPHIIRTHEVIQTEMQVFIVMEFANGGNLHEYVEKKKHLQEFVARRMFGELTSALKYLHNKLIYHRDLKSENILLDGNCRVKLADFGFSRKVNSHRQMLETYCGSFLFASPEIVQNRPYEGSKSDIWSLGIILYSMLTGKIPFSEDDIWKLDSDNIDSLLTFPRWPRVPPLAEELVREILAYTPQRRPRICEIEDHAWMGKHSEKFSKPGTAVSMMNGCNNGATKLPPLHRK